MRLKHILYASMMAAIAVAFPSCSNDDDVIPTYEISVADIYPSGIATPVIKSGTITFIELNTGSVYTFSYPMTATDAVPAGTYDIAGDIVVEITDADGTSEKNLRTVLSQQVVSDASHNLSLEWFYFNPDNTFVFGEIYFAGSLNATGTNGLYDSYFTIYNNTDEVLYADGLAIAESKFVNSSSDKILTAANQRETNFTAQTIYVIPGNGTSVPVQPGESIKIADQAIAWNMQVEGALDHTDADFEWYDESSSAKVVDTDNPDVPNLDKWYSYSPTIWLPSNQCNRSYALVKFPIGMTAEKFLAEQAGDYTYIVAATGTEMTGTKCYLIDYDWIIDGVNLCPSETWIQGALRASVDMKYAAISDKNSDKARFGKKFVRKHSGTSAAGHTVLQDTNNSAADFEIVSAK